MKRVLILFLLILSSAILFSQIENRKSRKASKSQNKVKNEINAVDQTEIPKNNIDNFNVKIKVTQYYPYCEGAYPDPEDLNNFSLLSNTNFILYNFKTKNSEIVKSDSTGTIKLNLPNGHYGIKEMYKNVSFEAFLKNYYEAPQMYFQGGDTACYKNWWMSYLSEFTLSDTIPYVDQNISIQDACFTGMNPCLYYFGPYPP